MSESFKNKVLAIYPDAVVAEDLDCNNNVYSTVLANNSRFIVVQIQNIVAEEGPYQTTYMQLIDGKELIRWLSGWQETIDDAWENAWDSISHEMLQKLER